MDFQPPSKSEQFVIFRNLTLNNSYWTCLSFVNSRKYWKSSKFFFWGGGVLTENAGILLIVLVMSLSNLYMLIVGSMLFFYLSLMTKPFPKYLLSVSKAITLCYLTTILIFFFKILFSFWFLGNVIIIDVSNRSSLLFSGINCPDGNNCD